MSSFMNDHPEQMLGRLPAGGFELIADGAPPTRFVPDRDGWRADGAAPDGWALRRPGEAGARFVLLAEDGETEIGRTMSLDGSDQNPDLYYLLLGDGRLFRIALRGPRDGRFELQGWETGGAYLEARPRTEDWKVAPTPACAGLDDIRALTILFAAEVLESERPLN